jgi:hypothetical protein
LEKTGELHLRLGQQSWFLARPSAALTGHSWALTNAINIYAVANQSGIAMIVILPAFMSFYLLILSLCLVNDRAYPCQHHGPLLQTTHQQ